MPEKRTMRVLIAKPGLDGHDKGAKIVAKGLKDAGMEVIYTGIRQTIDSIVNTALQEGVDVIGLSILSGTHFSNCKELMDKLEKEKLHKDIIVIVGGIIPKKDVAKLRETGMAAIFGPGTPIAEVSSFIKTSLAGKKA